MQPSPKLVCRATREK